jgi:hypothetical protein
MLLRGNAALCFLVHIEREKKKKATTNQILFHHLCNLLLVPLLFVSFLELILIWLQKYTVKPTPPFALMIFE